MVDAAKKLFEGYGGTVSFVASGDGYLPLDPASIDFVLMREMISHVNPTVLPIVWSELSRVLKPGGVVVISDGNNLDYPRMRKELHELFAAWENGPDGVKTSRDVVITSYRQRRVDEIHKIYPDLNEQRVGELADNTSGLWGETFRQAVHQAVHQGSLVRRPYRRDICPTNPDDTGVVMERPFRPQHVICELEGHGLKAQVVRPRLSLRRPRSVLALAAWDLTRMLEKMIASLRCRLAGRTFVVRGVKRS